MKKGVLHGLCSIPVNGQRPKKASKAGFEQRQPFYKSFP